MAVRHFTRASSEYIHFAIGAMPPFCNTTGAIGATCAAIIKKSSNTADFEYICYAGNDADPDNWQFYIGSTGDNKLGLWLGTAELKLTFTVLASEGWVMVAVTKASGTIAPKFHKVAFSAPTSWTHAASPTAGPNSGAVASKNTIGASNDHGGGFFDGHIAAVAVWGTELSDGALEALGPVNYANLGAAMTGWLATSPLTLWRLDQASTGTAVNDQTAGGANQNAISGTSVVTGDDPPFAPPSAAGGGDAAALAAMLVMRA